MGLMPRSHGHQRQQEKRKKRRELARRREKDRAAKLALPTGPMKLIQRASTFPHGPTFISPEWRDEGADLPGLVSIVVTRVAPSGVLVPGFALVDRTCLGVKNGFVSRPEDPMHLRGLLDVIEKAHGAIEPCDLLVAQSVLYHAIDFADSLGFAPHRDFPELLFGPRPQVLLDTPLARPPRPLYASGPNDDVARILGQLRLAVGDEFSFTLGDHGLVLDGDFWGPDMEDMEEEDGEDGEDDEDEEAAADEFSDQEDDEALKAGE